MSRLDWTIDYTLDEIISQVEKLIARHEREIERLAKEQGEVLENIKASGIEVTGNVIDQMLSNTHSRMGVRLVNINDEMSKKFNELTHQLDSNKGERRELKDWLRFFVRKHDRIAAGLGYTDKSAADFTIPLNKNDYEYFFPKEENSGSTS